MPPLRREARAVAVKVAVLVPWRPSVLERRTNWDYVSWLYGRHFPRWDQVVADSGSVPFSRTQSLSLARTKADAEVLVIADADCWVGRDALAEAVAAASEWGWAVPHHLVYRLSPWSSSMVRNDWTWKHLARFTELELSSDNGQDSEPYPGNPTGTLVVMRVDVFDEVPPDPRFVGWGQEDQAWAMALRELVGHPWRGSAPLMHLWHPPEPRLDRIKGSEESWALLERYRAARRNPERMRALIAEFAAP